MCHVLRGCFMTTVSKGKPEPAHRAYFHQEHLAEINQTLLHLACLLISWKL